MVGPTKSPYEGGVFFLNIKIPQDYPFKEPRFNFTSKIYHPNIDGHGVLSYCLEGMKCDDTPLKLWSPALTIKDRLLEIRAMLLEINTTHFINGEVAKVYMEDKEKFEKTAREWTRKYAS